jgi:hypothetical protein
MGDKKYAYLWYSVKWGGLIQLSFLSWTRIGVRDTLAKLGCKVGGAEGLHEGHVRCWRWIVERVCGVYETE